MTSIRLALVLALIGVGTHSAAAQSPTKPAQAPRPRPAARPSTPLPRGYVLIGASYGLSQNDFEDTVTPKSNAENGSSQLSYDVNGALGFEGAAAVRVWRSFGIRGGVGYSSTATAAALDASIPHPFFFDKPRTASATIDGLDRAETAIGVHFLAMFPINKSMQLAVFAGPTWIQFSQDTVQSLSYTETYPYDTITFSNAVTANSSDTKVTVGLGADFNYFFSKSIGLGGSVQFAQADVELSALNGEVKTVKAGGTKVGVSLTVRIP
jgi:hypothetical protein